MLLSKLCKHVFTPAGLLDGGQTQDAVKAIQLAPRDVLRGGPRGNHEGGNAQVSDHVDKTFFKHVAKTFLIMWNITFYNHVDKTFFGSRG